MQLRTLGRVLAIVGCLFLHQVLKAQSLNIPPSLQPQAISDELRRGTQRVDSVDIHYVTGGSGPVVLLWHGFLGNWASWRKLIPELIDDYTLVVPDMRGYGHSTVTDGGYDARTLMRDFRGLMQALGHNEFHIISHDMGSPPALLYAAEHPDEVLSLTYLDEPAMVSDTIADLIQMTPEDTHYGGLWWWMVAQSESMTNTLVLNNERNYIDWYYDHYTVDSTDIEEEARQYFAADLRGERGIHGWFGVYRETFATIEQTDALLDNKVETPILALGAELSLGDRVGQMLGAVATNVTTDTVANSGHFIAEEQPAALARRFRDFVHTINRPDRR